MFFCAKAKRQQQDVSHEGIMTEHNAFSLRSPPGSQYYLWIVPSQKIKNQAIYV